MITKKSLELQRKYVILLTLSVNCVAFCISFINTLYKTTELSGKTIRQANHKNIQYNKIISFVFLKIFKCGVRHERHFQGLWGS